MDWAVIAVLGVATSFGWSDITVSPSRNPAAGAPWQASLAQLDRPSERTNDTLRRYDLDRRFARDPETALVVLENQARKTPDPDLAFALAELSWVEGKRLDRKRRPEALDRYVDAVAYAFDYLFDPDLAAGRQVGDPRFRLAMDLYNGALDQILRTAKTSGGTIVPGQSIELKVHGKSQPIRIDLGQSPWKTEDVQELLLCSDFVVSGADLRTRSYQYGLGVPLIGVRHAPDPSQPAPIDPMQKYYPPEMAFPLTAFLRPNSRLRDPGADVDEVRPCTLYLLDPVRLRNVMVGPQGVPGGGGEAASANGLSLPIESDLTTPLAYMWSRTDLSRYRWRGFLRPGEAIEGKGLMLLRPYEPGKIPVVMVHGLMSSPLAWIPMLNELMRDPEIQRRYQFLLYVYPTGMPLPIAASYLRDALTEARMQFDPDGTNPDFNRMVLLGHSMGGLLAHAMAVDSGQHFWNLNSYKDFDELIGPPAVLDEMRHYTFFEALPFVERVVFLATPHRGSDYANRMIGRLGSSLIAASDPYTSLLSQLVAKNPDAFNSRRFKRLPTSIETLETDSDVLTALLEMKPRPGVVFHSIIGAKYPDGRKTTTDGVVPYRSSHFEGAVREKVVNSDHAVQKDPLAILEVRSILVEHLSSSSASPSRDPAALPASAPSAADPGLSRPRPGLVPTPLAP
jgi:pimeloyl-ACP methyl ester carboxylesterase